MHEEAILFDPRSKRFCVLNRTAVLLWEGLREPATVEEVTAEICRNFDGPDPVQVAEDVRSTLQELRGLALVETDA